MSQDEASRRAAGAAKRLFGALDQYRYCKGENKRSRLEDFHEALQAAESLLAEQQADGFSGEPLNYDIPFVKARFSEIKHNG